MVSIADWKSIDYDNIPEDSIWNTETCALSMHAIHTYPAKFPPFLAASAFDYAETEGVRTERVADVFCGCGTVALEAKIRGKLFWGCDINPVATLISKAKTYDYKEDKLRSLYQDIVERAKAIKDEGKDFYEEASERLQYWYIRDEYNSLRCIYSSIIEITRKGKYRDAFLCIFSAILKRTSRWLQKSIKPQIDPDKSPLDAFLAFSQKYEQFLHAVQEINRYEIQQHSDIQIINTSLYAKNTKPKNDLIITSPPYVTSYEYADLHQLSLLWLKYCDDYRDMRKGTVGSSYNCEKEQDITMNEAATDIVDRMIHAGSIRSKWMSVARYYRDMERTVEICKNMLNEQGMAIFVIGDSVLNGVKLANSQHLIESMLETGFCDVKMSKRKISKGICVPYREKNGRFTQSRINGNEIYHEEYIISGRKK